MEQLSDIFLAAAALMAGVYCLILGRKLNRFKNMEDGVGAAVTSLSAQVSDMTQMLDRANSTARSSVGKLEDSTARAEKAARRLELLIASLHDLPSEKEPTEKGGGQVPEGPASFVRNREVLSSGRRG